MKFSRLAIVGGLVLGLLTIGASVALAAKPQPVIEWSNGYPSGAHHNLNLHGKNADFNCDPAPGGSSAFILEYGVSHLEIVSNKKSSLDSLKAIDPCAEAFDGDPVKVQIPSEAEGYYVFAEVKGKPNNGKETDTPSSIVVTPNPVLEVCNDATDSVDTEFGDFTSCSDDDLLALGLVTSNGAYELTDQGFERFDSGSTSKGKGRSKAIDITGLFLWTGYVCDAALDVNGDGVIDAADVPLTYDADLSGTIDDAEFQTWLDDQVLAGTCNYYEDEWVFNVADLVVQESELKNDGVKLFKIRFYPVATTEFIR